MHGKTSNLAIKRGDVVMEKVNCYECEYRGNLAGDAHSCCEHPAYKDLIDNPMLGVLSIFASVGRMGAGSPLNLPALKEGCKVKLNPHGVKNNWANHPFNYDPIWVEECTGFKAKE